MIEFVPNNSLEDERPTFTSHTVASESWERRGIYLVTARTR